MRDKRRSSKTCLSGFHHGSCIVYRVSLLLLLLLFCPVLQAAGPDRLAFVVAVDVGHSEAQGGAVSARGIKEYHFNRAMAEDLRTKLVERGYAGSFIVAGNPARLEERTEEAARRKANLFISIHHDSVQPQYLESWEYEGKKLLYSDRFKGFSLFISQKNSHYGESLLLARLAAAEMVKEGFVPTLHHTEDTPGERLEIVDPAGGVYRFDDFVVLKRAQMPAILVECGIIVNRDEERLLSDPAYRGRMASAIVRAVETYREKVRR